MFTEGLPHYEKHGMHCAERELMLVIFSHQAHNNCSLNNYVTYGNFRTACFKLSPRMPWRHMIYLTAIGLPPGCSSTVHIYTQTIHITTIDTKQYTEQHNSLIRKSAGRAPFCEVYMGRGDKVPVIFNVDTRWTWVVKHTTRPLSSTACKAG
jgi:hypothetical protein